MIVQGKPRIYAALLVVTACLLTLLALIGCWPANDTATDLEEAEVAYVIDGDTIAVSIGGEEHRVRLVNCNTPELESEEGESAANYTRQALQDRGTVWLEREESETDKYGRLLRHVWLEVPANRNDPDEVASKMLDAMLIRDGIAEAVDYPPDTRYSELFHQLQHDAELKAHEV